MIGGSSNKQSDKKEKDKKSKLKDAKVEKQRSHSDAQFIEKSKNALATV